MNNNAQNLFRYYYTPEINIFRTDGNTNELLFGKFPLTDTWTAHERPVTDEVL